MEIIGYTLIAIGAFFILSSVVGLLRLPCFFTKIHAASIADSTGIPLTLLGLAMLQNSRLTQENQGSTRIPMNQG